MKIIWATLTDWTPENASKNRKVDTEIKHPVVTTMFGSLNHTQDNEIILYSWDILLQWETGRG